MADYVLRSERAPTEDDGDRDGWLYVDNGEGSVFEADWDSDSARNCYAFYPSPPKPEPLVKPKPDRLECRLDVYGNVHPKCFTTTASEYHMREVLPGDPTPDQIRQLMDYLKRIVDHSDSWASGTAQMALRILTGAE